MFNHTVLSSKQRSQSLDFFFLEEAYLLPVWRFTDGFFHFICRLCNLLWKLSLIWGINPATTFTQTCKLAELFRRVPIRPFWSNPSLSFIPMRMLIPYAKVSSCIIFPVRVRDRTIFERKMIPILQPVRENGSEPANDSYAVGASIARKGYWL